MVSRFQDENWSLSSCLINWNGKLLAIIFNIITYSDTKVWRFCAIRLQCTHDTLTYDLISVLKPRLIAGLCKHRSFDMPLFHLEGICTFNNRAMEEVLPHSCCSCIFPLTFHPDQTCLNIVSAYRTIELTKQDIGNTLPTPQGKQQDMIEPRIVYHLRPELASKSSALIALLQVRYGWRISLLYN